MMSFQFGSWEQTPNPHLAMQTSSSSDKMQTSLPSNAMETSPPPYTMQTRSHSREETSLKQGLDTGKNIHAHLAADRL